MTAHGAGLTRSWRENGRVLARSAAKSETMGSQCEKQIRKPSLPRFWTSALLLLLGIPCSADMISPDDPRDDDLRRGTTIYADACAASCPPHLTSKLQLWWLTKGGSFL